ncbi:hypothetical protein BGW42_000534 [Actinomortierella wolfii]|nr:hypothetical protein BGW42_000534 [Actinomortierella wolfii]
MATHTEKKEKEKEMAASKRAPKKEDEADNTDDGEGDDDGVYEVERVVGHRRDPETNELAYFLKWVGYPHEDSTWEMEDQVFCTDLVAEYWQRHLERGGSKNDLYAEESIEKKTSKRGGKSTAATSAGSSSSTTKTNGAGRNSKSLLPDVPPLGSSKTSGSNATSTLASSRRKEKASPDEVPPNKRQKTASAVSSKPWTPPSSWSTWENEVIEVKDVERSNGKLIIYLSWKDGHETAHTREEVHERCPRKLLKFYEDHLKFKEA